MSPVFFNCFSVYITLFEYLKMYKIANIGDSTKLHVSQIPCAAPAMKFIDCSPRDNYCREEWGALAIIPIARKYVYPCSIKH